MSLIIKLTLLITIGIYSTISFSAEKAKCSQKLKPAVVAGKKVVAEAAKDADKKAFRTLMNKLSEQSSTQPLECTQVVRAKDGSYITSAATYKLSTEDDSEYQGAFAVTFSGTNNFQTLVAYEGYNKFLLGSLTVTRSAESTIYRHQFDGFLKDIITLTVSKDGHVDEFSYEKINPQRISFLKISCILKK